MPNHNVNDAIRQIMFLTSIGFSAFSIEVDKKAHSILHKLVIMKYNTIKVTKIIQLHNI